MPVNRTVISQAPYRLQSASEFTRLKRLNYQSSINPAPGHGHVPVPLSGALLYATPVTIKPN